MTEIELAGARVIWGDSGADFAHESYVRLKQVHGNEVLVDPATGDQADASITARSDVVLAIATADCAPIAMSSPEGIVAAVHAGWRGLEADVVGSAAKQMREMGATKIVAALGPCIHGECYEFSRDELLHMQALFGAKVAVSTKWGTDGLDMIAATRATCEQNDVALEYVHESCTACDESFFSYRARKDEGRQLMLVSRI